MDEDAVRDSLSIVVKGEVRSDGQLNNIPEVKKASYLKAVNKLKQKSSIWINSLGIQGLGLGEKLTKGQYDETIVIRAYVNKKKPLSKLKNRVPKTIVIPEIGRVRTDVIEVGDVVLHSLNSRMRPVAPGCSIGHVDGTSGSLGCVVRIKGNSGTYILSSAHILSDFDQVDSSDVILQPSKKDDRNYQNNVVAKLEKYTAYDFTRGAFNNTADAAVAKISPGNITKSVSLIGKEPSGIRDGISRGTVVKKVGSTTGLTWGEVLDVDYTFSPKMPYGNGSRRRAGFYDQVMCTPFTQNGDSGAAILDSENRLIGLHMAGSSRASIFNKITNVFNVLDLDI